VPNLERAYKMYEGMIKKNFVQPGHVAGNTYCSLSQGYFDMIGRVQRSVQYRDKIVPSTRFQKFVGDFIPNYVYCNANKEAELKSVAKYDRGQPELDLVNWALANNWCERHFVNMRGSSEVDYDTVVESLDKTTSPGYPWSLNYASKKEVLNDERFRPFLEKIYDRMSYSIDFPDYTFFWTSSVKAEMRPVEKAKENKLRTFCASPLELTMISNMLCLDANQKFYELGARNKVWSCVGMSKYNCGWDMLSRRLSKHPNGYALDVSSYDSSVFRKSLLEICEFRCECGNYDLAQQTVLRNVYQHYLNSVMVLTNGDVVMKTTGNPSGSGNTVVDNTLHLYKLLAYCWCVLCPPEMRSYESFHANVEAALYGDDNTFTCSDLVNPWFNAKTVAAVAATIGVKVTAEDDIWEARPLSGLKFLAQGFRFVDQTWWVPVPETNKVLSSMIGNAACHDPRWDLLRASALLMDAWWNEEARSVLQSYIHYLYKDFSHYMCDGEVYKGITYNQITSAIKNERQIRSLYFSTESAVPAANGDLADPFNFVHNFALVH